jgi:hypothetical protein
MLPRCRTAGEPFVIPYGQKMQPHYFTSSYAPTMIHSLP